MTKPIAKNSKVVIERNDAFKNNGMTDPIAAERPMTIVKVIAMPILSTAKPKRTLPTPHAAPKIIGKKTSENGKDKRKFPKFGTTALVHTKGNAINAIKEYTSQKFSHLHEYLYFKNRAKLP